MAANFDNAFEKILNNSLSIMTKACRRAAKKAHEDIIKESKRQLKQYYASYKPKRYNRTGKLRRAITPIYRDSSTKEKAFFEIGVKYDANKLVGFYHSGSWYHQSGTEWFSRSDSYFDWDSSNNGTPSPEWILNNYLEGKHIWGSPDTYGPQTTGTHSWGHIDEEAPGTLMQDFFEITLPGIINKYISQDLTRKLIKELSK